MQHDTSQTKEPRHAEGNGAGCSDGESSVGEHAKSWLAATRSRAQSVAQLAVAEAKLAAISIAMMAFFGAIAAGFVLVAWGLVVAAVLQVLGAQDIPLWIAMLMLALAHGVAAIILWRAATRLSANLEFNVTRGQLTDIGETP